MGPRLFSRDAVPAANWSVLVDSLHGPRLFSRGRASERWYKAGDGTLNGASVF